MKLVILLCCLSVMVLSINANPLPPMVLSEVWFAQNGHFMMEFANSWSAGMTTADIYIKHGGEQQAIQGTPILLPYLNQNETGVVVDMTERMPQMVFNPAGDSLSILVPSTSHLFEIASLKWGDGFENDINPPNPGQSLVYDLCLNGHFYGELVWAKEEPPTPYHYTNRALARDTLTVIVTDQNGNPVPNARIINPRHYPSDFYTDANGRYSDAMIASKFLLQVFHPVTNEPVFSQQYWLEPNQSTTIPVQITITGNEDNTAPALTPKGLSVFPSPYNLHKSGSVTFCYDGNEKLSGKSIIKLYDTKGRLVSQVPMSAKGTANWKPMQDISSGMYFARLISGNRIVDTTPLTLIK